MGKSTHKLSFSVLPLVYTLRDNFKYRIDAVFAYLLTNIKMKTHSEANSDPFRGQSNYCGFVKVMGLRASARRCFADNLFTKALV
jgi:hypothetical protein